MFVVISFGSSATEIHGRDLLAEVIEFVADFESGCAVQCFLFSSERLRVWATRCRCLPAREFVVAVLGVGMSESVHLAQTRSERLSFVQSQLLDVISVRGNERTHAGQLSGTVQHLALLSGSNRDDARLAALGLTRS